MDFYVHRWSAQSSCKRFARGQSSGMPKHRIRPALSLYSLVPPQDNPHASPGAPKLRVHVDLDQVPITLGAGKAYGSSRSSITERIQDYRREVSPGHCGYVTYFRNCTTPEWVRKICWRPSLIALDALAHQRREVEPVTNRRCGAQLPRAIPMTVTPGNPNPGHGGAGRQYPLAHPRIFISGQKRASHPDHAKRHRY